MKTTVELLDQARAVCGGISDYELAKRLQLTRSAVSKLRTGKAFLGEETAVKIAELVGLDAGYVLSCIAAERAKRTAVKKAWSRAAAKLAGAVTVAAGLFFGPLALGIGDGETFAAPLSSYTLYEVAHWLYLVAACSLALWLLEQFPDTKCQDSPIAHGAAGT